MLSFLICATLIFGSQCPQKIDGFFCIFLECKKQQTFNFTKMNLIISTTKNVIGKEFRRNVFCKDIDAMNPPTKRIDTLGATNKKKLRDAFGYANIRSAFAVYNVDTADEVYAIWQDLYNQFVDDEVRARDAQKQAEKEQKKLQKQAERAERARAKAEKKRQELAEEKRVAKSVIFDLRDDDIAGFGEAYINTRDQPYEIPQIFLNIVSRLSQMQGQEINLMASRDGTMFRSKRYTITKTNLTTIYYDTLFDVTHRYVDGAEEFIGSDANDYIRIVITVGQEPIPERLVQRYLDGEKHCVIEPLRNLFQGYADNSETKDSCRKFMGTIKKLNELEKIYLNGVPEDDMEVVAKAINRCIVIHSIAGTELKRYNDKCKRYVHFTNTRENHLDFHILSVDYKEFKSVNKEDMGQILQDHINKNVFYMTTGDPNNTPVKLVSSLGSWICINDDYNVYNEFDKHINKKSYRLNARKYPEINDFVLEGRIINSTPTPLCDEPNDLTDVNHIDLEKAYSQHKNCDFYQGFLGNITNYGKVNTNFPSRWLKEHIGIYQFEVIKNPSELIRNMGIFEKHIYILPSCEILAFIQKWKLQVRLISGVFGSSFDFEYTPEMLEQKRYATWAGKCGISTSSDRFNFPGTQDWAKHLRHELGSGKVYYNDEDQMITLKVDRQNYHTYHHILAFITSYTRLNVLSILDTIPEENRVKVILDGIYYRGELQSIEKVVYKTEVKLKEHTGFRQFWYYPTEYDCSAWEKVDERFIQTAILSGAGGSGKTHSVYTCKSLIQPMYVVPTHILGSQMREKYGCSYITINSLIGDGCQSYQSQYGISPPVILIDELTMIRKDDIEKALAMYPKSLIFLAGDIDETQWYQCRNGKEGMFNALFRPKNFKYVHFTNDYRSVDANIKQLKLDIRAEMKRVFADRRLAEDFVGGSYGAKKMRNWILENQKTITLEEAMRDFKSNKDVFIAGTHRTNDILLKNNCISGHIDKMRRINFNAEGEARGSFTIHSYQGLTIEDKKVYIGLDMFEYAMLYTAVSRCRRMEQIVFVNI